MVNPDDWLWGQFRLFFVNTYVGILHDCRFIYVIHFMDIEKHL